MQCVKIIVKNSSNYLRLQPLNILKQVDFLTRTERDTRLSYDQLKDFILQDEAEKQTGKEHASTTALAIGRSRFKITCRNCLGLGHIKILGPNAGKIRCRNCKQLRDHMARDCPNPAVTCEISTQENNRGGRGRLWGGFGRGRFAESSRNSENKRFRPPLSDLRQGRTR